MRGVNPTFRAAPNNSALIDVIMCIIGMKQAYHGMILRTQSHAQKYAQSHAQKYAVARSRTRSRTQSLQAARLRTQSHTSIYISSIVQPGSYAPIMSGF